MGLNKSEMEAHALAVHLVTQTSSMPCAYESLSKHSLPSCLDGRLVQVPDVAGGLAGFLSQHHCLRTDAPESVHDDLATNALNGIDDHSHGALVQRLERLLGVHVHAGEPAPKAGVGVIPAHDHFWPATTKGTTQLGNVTPSSPTTDGPPTYR